MNNKCPTKKIIMVPIKVRLKSFYVNRIDKKKKFSYQIDTRVVLFVSDRDCAV